MDSTNDRYIKKIRVELKNYIENNIFPLYNQNEIGHGVNHIRKVIERGFEIIEENNLDVNYEMIYTAIAYHDIGHHINPKQHEIISAQIMFDDKNLYKFFSKEELIIIKEAIEDHRASSKVEPRSIYGKIVSSADRNNTIEDCLKRTYTYGKKLNPNVSDEELFLRAYDILNKKFGNNGYAKFYFKDKKYEEFLKEIRYLLQDKDKFITTQRDYINLLKKEKAINK